MNARIGCALIALAAMTTSISAGFRDITTTAVNIPATVFLMTLGPDGNVWVVTDTGNLGKLTPANVYTEFPLAWGPSQHGTLTALGFTSGIDGNLWVTGVNGHIQRVTTNGAVTDFALAPSFYFTGNPVRAADGAIWFFDRQFPGQNVSSAWKFGRVDIYGQLTTYDLGFSGDFLAGLVSGGDGNLWFIDETKSQVVKFSLVTKSVAGTFAIPSASNENGNDQTVLAWDGNVWFTRGTSLDRVTVDGTITEFHLPSGGQPAAILMSGDNSIWFTEASSGKIGQLLLSSISGNNATFNENIDTIPDVSQLIILPPAFSAASATAQSLPVIPNDVCIVKVMSGKTVQGEPVVHEYLYPPPCSSGGVLSRINSQPLDVFIYILTPIFAIEHGKSITSDDVTTNTVILNVNSAPGGAITDVSTNDPAAAVSFSATRATITSSMPNVAATVRISKPPQGAIAGTTVLSSSASDPDPRQHIASFYVDASSLGGRIALPPSGGSTITNPITRGH